MSTHALGISQQIRDAGDEELPGSAEPSPRQHILETVRPFPGGALAGPAGGPEIFRYQRRRPRGRMGTVADDILELQRAFDDAEMHGDAGRLGALLADDFLSIGEQGFVLGKREWISRHADFRYLAR
jgi:hypothetical protein